VADPAEHALVVYRAGARADAALQSVRQRVARVTVVAIAREEPRRNGCCDTRSVLWNRICRELAHEDLTHAADALDDHQGVEFRVLVAQASDPVDAIGREALQCGAGEIVLADPRASGLSRLEQRRLRRQSATPVRS
jgi:hypothetical protein